MSSESDTSVSDLSRAELEARLRDLESDHAEMQARVDALSRRLDSVVQLLIGERDLLEAEDLVDDALLDVLTGSDTRVRSVDRDALLPIHNMWLDLRSGREDAIGSKSARRGARLFGCLWRRAAGEAEPAVDVTKKYYVLDSAAAREQLREADDLTDSGVSKTVARSMRAVQRFTKVDDCDCGSIDACDHGLVIYDASGGTNRLRCDKERFNAYGRNVETASRDADDRGEQPREAPPDTDVVTAADDELDAIASAQAVTDEQSDNVVRSFESKSSDRPLLPEQPQD